MMAVWRRRIAGWICPELVAESDRLWWLRVDISEKQRWLGHYYPQVDTVLERVSLSDLNRSPGYRDEVIDMSDDKRAHWPKEIGSFRQAMFEVYPVDVKA
jgi:hypothetical protein